MDYTIAHYLNSFGQGTVVDNFSYYLSLIPFLGVLWALLVFLLMIFRRSIGFRVFWGSIIAFVIYFILNDLFLKQAMANFYFRERPYLAHPGVIIPIGTAWTDSSFWSGHMALLTALIIVFVFFYRRWWTVTAGIIMLILVGLSRLHNGMHYPTDVLMGTALGVGYGYFAAKIGERLKLRQPA